MSLLTEASLVILPNAVEEGTLFSIIPADGSGDMTAVRATTATLVNSEGVIEDVAINVPRLDYTNGSCPSILVEPQRTNLVTWSEDFTNAIWERATSGSATISVTSNATTAPNGTTTADLVTINRSSVSETSLVYKITNTPAGTYKGSVWLKAKDSASVGKTIDLWSWDGNTNGYTKVTLTADWKRHEQATTVFSGTGQELFDFGLLPNTYSTSTTLSVEFYIWGAQSEAGSYATSYIPTTSASVTRNADVISKTGISDLIGQIEGTMYAEVDTGLLNSGGVLLTLSNGSFANFIILAINSSNRIELVWRTNGSAVNVFATPNDVSNAKIAVSYEADNIVFYVNGNLINTGVVDVNWSVPLSQLDLGHELGSVARLQRNNTTAIWKTALTDQECINLTTL